MEERIGLLLSLGWIMGGLICMAAAGDAITHWTGLWRPVSYPLALSLGFAPILGAVLTFLGAVYAWHLAWYWALLLALPQIPLVFAVVAPTIRERLIDSEREKP